MSFERRSLLVSLFLLIAASLYSQEESKNSGGAPWEFSVTGFYYVIPHDKDEISGVATGDVKNLHLETRYNYEDYHTGSFFVGRKFIFGNELAFDITPIMGLVFGNTNGMAPGVELFASYKKFDFYVESEWLIDFSGPSNS